MDLEQSLAQSLAQLAEVIKAKAASAATAPPESRQVQDPTRARTGVAASKVFEYKDGKLTGYVETKADGERVHQVFARDKAGRISKIVTVPAGALTAPSAFKSRGGFLPPPLPEPEFKRVMKAAHEAAWVEFVAKHGAEVIAKSSRRRAR